jgi:DNA invertase Pin-like site-specific DNA recombinase
MNNSQLSKAMKYGMYARVGNPDQITRGHSKTAFSYLRASTFNNRSTMGIFRQNENVINKAEDLNIRIVERFIDVDKSGQSMRRPAMHKMIRAIKSHKRPVDYIIAEKPCRLTRNIDDHERFMDLLKRSGIELIYAT